MVTKIYCDLCKKEIEGFGRVIEIKITPNAIGFEGSSRDEVCKDCSEKIINFMNKLKVKW